MTTPAAAAATTQLNALVVQPGETRSDETLNVLGTPVLVKVAGTDTNGQMAMFYIAATPMSGPPLHRHSREDELFYVLDGEITWEIDGRRITGGPGTTVLAPRGSAHSYQNFTEETAHMLVMVTPAGFERFFEEIHRANQGRSEPDLGEATRIMADHGVELLGPPLARR